jgi:hypothetical protein
MMLGVGGTVGASGSGSLADGWRGATASTAAGVTRTYTKVVRGTKTWQEVTIGGPQPTSAGRLDVLQQISLQANIVAGGVYEVVGEYEMDANNVGILSIQAGIQINTDVVQYDGDRYDADQYLPAMAQTGVFRSPQMTISTAPTDIRLLVSVYVSNLVAPVGTMRFRSVALRRVA